MLRSLRRRTFHLVWRGAPPVLALGLLWLPVVAATPAAAAASTLTPPSSAAASVGVGLGAITTATIPSLPEPTSMLLFGTGLLGLAAHLRRQIRK